MFVERETKKQPFPQPEKITDTSPQDRRYLPRWEVDNKILFKKEDETTEYECHSKDINCTGACIRTREDIAPNQELDLTIYLADDIEPIRVHGRTLWRIARDNESLVGGHFDRVSDKTGDLIFNYAFEYKKEEVLRHWFKGS